MAMTVADTASADVCTACSGLAARDQVKLDLLIETIAEARKIETSKTEVDDYLIKNSSPRGGSHPEA